MNHCRGDRWAVACLSIFFIAGCSGKTDGGPDPSKLVPVSGIATLDGNPVADATVTFLPKSSAGYLATGRTDESGKYELETGAGSGKTNEGVVPGAYNVIVTKFTKVDGTPIELDPKEAPMNQGAVLGVPLRYTGVDENGLFFTVPADGGTYDIKMEK